jgi:hypothetical protein
LTVCPLVLYKRWIDSAKGIAMFYSFFATRAKNNIDPQKWLIYVIKNINDTKNSELKYLPPQFIDKNQIIEVAPAGEYCLPDRQ